MPSPLIFDGHNDVLLRLYECGGGDSCGRFVADIEGHLDLQKMRAGGFAGGFFAVYVPSPDDGTDLFAEMTRPSYRLPLPPEIPQEAAFDVAMAQVRCLKTLEDMGHLSICTSVSAIRGAVAAGKVAALLHMEGAEAIGADLDRLDHFYALGLRSLGPVWSRPTPFAHGVPFAYPSDPDTGGGLTEAGRTLVRACNRLGIMLDVSHLNAAGFRDLADLTERPIVATHSNAHALCPHSRNLTDEQLQIIADSRGVVGLNFATAMLRQDGKMLADTPVSVMGDHVLYLLDKLGEDGVALGSDFDGAIVPDAIGDASGLDALRDELLRRGVTARLLQKICFDNWMSVLDRSWKPSLDSDS